MPDIDAIRAVSTTTDGKLLPGAPIEIRAPRLALVSRPRDRTGVTVDIKITTIRMPEDVAKAVRITAAYIDTNAHAFMMDAIREAVKRETKKARELGELISKATK